MRRGKCTDCVRFDSIGVKSVRGVGLHAASCPRFGVCARSCMSQSPSRFDVAAIPTPEPPSLGKPCNEPSTPRMSVASGLISYLGRAVCWSSWTWPHYVVLCASCDNGHGHALKNPACYAQGRTLDAVSCRGSSSLPMARMSGFVAQSRPGNHHHGPVVAGKTVGSGE